MPICTVLVVSKDDLLPAEMADAIGHQLEADWLSLDDEGELFELRFEPLLVRGEWEVRIPEGGYELCILSDLGGSSSISASSFAALARSARSLLVISEHGGQHLIPSGSTPCATLVRPFTRADLVSTVTQLLRHACRHNESDAFQLLRHLLAERRLRIEPVVTGPLLSDIRYPTVETHLDPLADATAVLSRLEERGALEPEVVGRLRLCRECDGHHLAFEECCPGCQSLDFRLEPVLHHFACGHVAHASAFGGKDRMGCPKCGRDLLQIGRDHERVNEQMVCSCGDIAAEPAVRVRCWTCGTIQSVEQTREHLLLAYRLHARAEELVLEADPRNHTARRDPESGLHHRSLLILEVDRESARCARRSTAFSIIALNVLNLDELRDCHGVASLDYWKHLNWALVHDLRRQDLAAQWSADTAVVLLPDSDETAAQVVLERFANRIDGLFDGWVEPFPVVGLAAATWDTEDADGAEVVRRAITMARSTAETETEVEVEVEVEAEADSVTASHFVIVE